MRRSCPGRTADLLATARQISDARARHRHTLGHRCRVAGRAAEPAGVAANSCTGTTPAHAVSIGRQGFTFYRVARSLAEERLWLDGAGKRCGSAAFFGFRGDL